MVKQQTYINFNKKMEYRTNEAATLVSYIKNESVDQASKLLRMYGDVREERGIISGWNKCIDMIKRCRKSKENRQRKFILEADNNYIEVHEFNKLLYFVIDGLEKLKLDGRYSEIDDFIAELEVKLGTVKMDRRLTFLQD